MSQKDKELDEFWDLSSLIPKKSVNRSNPKNSNVTLGTEISFSHADIVPKESTSSTVIKRYINPLHDENKKIRKEAFSSTYTYTPQGSLLHSVTLKKRKSAYELYSDFVFDALKYFTADAKETQYTPFFSYVPQYNQLSSEQLEYYLWWRENFKRGAYIKVDLSYILLYAYELINLGDAVDVISSQRSLTMLWNVYHKEFPAISGKLALWICDFSLLHELPPPNEINGYILKYIPSLKEFFIHIPKGDYTACVSSLLKYGTEYDYTTSKFATDKNKDIFERHIFGAMLCAVKYFSVDGKILSGLAHEDSKLVRNAFDGALCSSNQRYEIEVKYCSFSRSNELRFIMGDIVKYSENKIRAFLGIKSRLSVYSIHTELQGVLDAYFADAFLNEAPILNKKPERAEYDVLYDIPLTPLSIENAKKIESDSWRVTNDLVTAFDDCEFSPYHDTVSDIFDYQNPSLPDLNTVNKSDIKSALGDYLDFVMAIQSQNQNKAEDFANKKGKMLESIVDAVNEISSDVLGDILIEDTDNGFEIVEYYKDLINK